MEWKKLDISDVNLDQPSNLRARLYSDRLNTERYWYKIKNITKDTGIKIKIYRDKDKKKDDDDCKFNVHNHEHILLWTGSKTHVNTGQPCSSLVK